MMVLKKIFAVTLAAALPIVAVAQTTEAKPAEPVVQLYGTLNVNLQYTEASGATAPGASVKPRFAISTDSTNLGVRGTLDLASGYKAVYQCETQANLDGEDTRALCNRNSRVGLQSFWGTVFFGNWDTPFKNSHYGTKADDPFGNTDAFGFNGVLGSPGYGVRSSAFNSSPGNAVTASFDQRAANSLAYWSPKFNGFGAKLQYSFPEFRTQNASPQLFSLGLNYDMGPLSVFATTEYHEDAFGIRTASGGNAGTTTSKDLAWRLGAGYEIPLGGGALTLDGMLEQLSYGQSDTTVGFKDYSRMAWLLGAKFRTGNHEVRFRFSQALKPSITAANGTVLAAGAEDSLGAQSFAAGYAFQFAKSTQLFAFYTQIANDARARYTFGVGGAANVVGTNTPAGSTVSAGGVGIRLAFP